MKKIGCITTVEDIIKIKPYCEAVMIEAPFLSAVQNASYDVLEAIQKVEEQELLPILKVNRMVLPEEIEEIKKKLEPFMRTSCFFYITDLGLAYFLKQQSVLHRVIFDPVTMITNALDARVYQDYGFAAVGLSSEITIEDVRKILSKTSISAFYQVFGYHIMFHSKRPLVSLYGKKINKVIPLEQLTLQEATRQEQYPIEENDQGTFIFRSTVLSLLKELPATPLSFLYFDSYRIPQDIYLEVLAIYHDVLQGSMSMAVGLEKLRLLDLPFGDGFTYQDSVYQKEAF